MTENSKKIDWLRVALCAVSLCIVAVALFSFYDGKGAELIDSASADDKSPNLVWVYEHVFAAIPALAMVLVAELFYLGKDRYIPITTHTEKSIIFGGVIFFIYALMLPCVLIASPETIDPETGKAVETLWTRTYEWFFAQILPLGIVILYHGIRLGAEKSGAAFVEDDEPDVDDEEDDSDE